MLRHKVIAGLIGVLWIAGAMAGDLTDEQVRGVIVQNSIAAYPGNCPCPYYTDRAGRSCGARSAWSRAGGYAPVCYTREVTDRQVKEFRDRHHL